MSDVQIAVVDQQDTQIVLAVPGVQGATGSEIPTGGTADQVLRKSSSTNYDTNWSQVTSAMIADGTIVNADINASAAIAGTKISPDFGSQTVQTTGVISHALGTAGAPTVTFTGDTNTGIYSPGADQVAISTGGTGRLFVDASGNVILGTASILSGASGRTLQIGTTTDSASTLQFAATTTGNSYIQFGDGGSPESYAGYLQYAHTDNALLFGTNKQERLRITSAGLVGIGTSSPSSKLDVRDASVSQITSSVNGVQTAVLGSDTSTGAYTGTLDNYPYKFLVNGSVKATLTSTGLGIGTTSPGSPLTIESSAGNQVKITYPSIASYFLNATSGGDFAINKDGTERARIDSSGRLGIGTSSPSAQLDLVGTAPGEGLMRTSNGTTTSFFGATATSFAFWNSGLNPFPALAIGTTTNHPIVFGTNNTGRVVIDTSGNVGIGTATPDALLTAVASSATNGVVANFANSTTGALLQFSQTGIANWRVGSPAGQDALAFYRYGSGAYPEAARIDSSGRLLVGTSSARANYFNSTATTQLQIEKAGGGGGVSIISDSVGDDPAVLILGKSNNASVGGNTVVAVDNFLGTVSFQGNDGSEFVDAARISCYVDGTPGANDMPGRLVFSTTADGASSPTSRLVIKENGDILIPSGSATKGFWIGTGDAAGNGASGNYRIGQNSFGVGSSTLYIGNAAIQVSSDARLKENIQDTTLSAVEELQKVRVVDFTWNDPSDTSYNNRNVRGTWTGVIAQELVEIFPFAVNAPRKENDLSIDHDSDSTWTVEQQQLVPVLIKAIQEQQAVIADLQSRLVVLETK